MPASHSSKLHGSQVTIEAAQATLPAPSTSSDGASVASINQRTVAVSLFADGAATVTDAWLCGYDAQDAKWYKLAPLNSGNAITLTATLGWENTFTDACVNDRLAVCAAIAGGNNVGATVKPLEVVS